MERGPRTEAARLGLSPLAPNGRVSWRSVVQLELFHGDHLPLLRAHAALDAGDFRRAHEALASVGVESEAARTMERLAVLEVLVPHSDESSFLPPHKVHALFEEAFSRGVPAGHDARGPTVGPLDWFRLYAVHLAAALAPTPERRFRGWCALHFELAAQRPLAALALAERLISTLLSGRTGGDQAPPAGLAPSAESACPESWAWLEAARAAHAAGDPERSRRWTLVACLASAVPLQPAQPRLEPTGRSELNAPEWLLPRLSNTLEDLWTEAFVLGLAEPTSAWVPCLGVLDGVFALADLRSPEVAQGARFDLEHPATAESHSRSFLRALVVARELRGRKPRAAGEHLVDRCDALELRARKAMKSAAPILFERYMQTLGVGLD